MASRNDADWEEEFIEKGASLEHERWSRWQDYLFSRCVKVTGVDEATGEEVLREVVIPPDLYERWIRQINTGYEDLSEEEKESDRREVRKYLPIIRELVDSLCRPERAEEKEKTPDGNISFPTE